MASCKNKVLIICLGNICRSPIAEAVLKDELSKQSINNWYVDSAALGPWHVGKKPDRRALETMTKHDISTDHRAREITTDDFLNFEYIIGMDDDNMVALDNIAPANNTAKLERFGHYHPEKIENIRDPYYDSGAAGFETCYQQSVLCAKSFIDHHCK